MSSEIQPTLQRQEFIQASKIKAKFSPQLQSTKSEPHQPASSKQFEALATSASNEEQDSLPSTVPRFASNDPSFDSATAPSFLLRTEMANPAFFAQLPSAPTANIVDDGAAPVDTDARSVVSDVSSIFHGATDERSTLVRGHRRNLAAAMRLFVDTWTAARAPHLDADAAFDMAQLADERRRTLLAGIWQFVDVVHSTYPTNDGGDVSARILIAKYVGRFENDVTTRP